uniref:Protein GrpE n=1 Tax=Eiseniibacteriota bacterium TaxID=2212470 RepID=A0A832I484_UNCEI
MSADVHDRTPNGEPPEEAAAPADESAAPATGAPAEAAPATAAPAAESAEVYRDRWLRAEAELQNYRRRAARDREEARRAAEDAGLLEMIAVLDDLERALAAAAEAGAPENWTQGVRLVVQRAKDALARAGVRVIDPRGEAFDPAFHDALIEVDAPEGVAPGHVVDVVLKGYARGDRALRAARVAVARAAADGGR